MTGARAERGGGGGGEREKEKETCLSLLFCSVFDEGHEGSKANAQTPWLNGASP